MLILVALTLFLCNVQGNLSFLTIGDWGGVGLDDYHATDEIAVAKQMGITATTLNISWVINVGDNFYYVGVTNTTDPQWQEDFELVFTQPSLMVKWYSILGNHDYGENPGCQTQYKSPSGNRWYMPDRNYTFRMELDKSGVYASFVFIDSNPCISAYRSNNPAGWDPPPDEAPLFHDNIINQSCTAQYAWFQEVLKSVPSTDWLFIVGHHPADEIDVEDFTSVMQAANMDMYFCGHSHLLELFEIDGYPTPYVISGAGCMVQIPSLEHNHTHELSRHELGETQGLFGHTYKDIWSNQTAGFVTHTFSSNYLSLTTYYWDYLGNLIYSFSTNKH